MIKWVITLLLMLCFALLMTNRKLELKSIYIDYQYVKGPVAKQKHIERGRLAMRPKLIPYALKIYSSGRDIEFAEAMIGAACDYAEGIEVLRRVALDEDTVPLERTICLAHLLNNDQLWAWTIMDEEDIDTISASMPAHVVHWKHLLVKYMGLTHAYLSKDTYPERHKFKAAMRSCIQQYTASEERRAKRRQADASG